MPLALNSGGSTGVGLLERLRHFAGRDLARLDIGLVERIDAKHYSGHGGRDLEAEKFLREKLWRTDSDAHHGMPVTRQRINELVLRRIRMRGVAQIHEQPMRVVGGRLAERLIGDGNHTLYVFAVDSASNCSAQAPKEPIDGEAMMVSLSCPATARTPIARPSATP